MDRTPGSPKVFFSSCFTDTSDIDLEVRARVRKEFNGHGERLLWLAEDFPNLNPGRSLPIDNSLFCVQGVRQCDAYVAVIIDKHGSGIGLAPERKTQVSFLELELFEAAISGKPAFVFILEGHKPTGRMAALLDLLAPALPGLCCEPLSEDEIIRSIGVVVESVRRPWLSRLKRFVALDGVASDRLGAARHRPYRPATELPALQFLNGAQDPTIEPPSLDCVETLLKLAETYDDELAVVWLALRELMGVPQTRASGDHMLHCWDVALDKWRSSGAWYGLHGFCLMGCLGAIGSRSRIYQEMTVQPPTPHGAFASEYYSISKRVADPALRKSFLDLAFEHIELARESENERALGVRGSILLEAGRYKEAITDYERLLAVRAEQSEPPEKIGEVMAELGFALIHDRSSRRRGIELLEQGVGLCGEGNSAKLLVRAKRKLGVGYLRSWAPRRALGQLVEAHEVAVQNSLFDQIHTLESAARRIDRAIPFLRYRD